MTEPAAPSLHHDVKAYVTGYNTVAGQTDSTPCIAASGANICGRHDAVACPRRIGLGTVIEIRGTTYVCEDRLAKKFDDRFDISCDKDTDCPPQVTGWVTIKVYGEERPQPAVAVTIAEPPRKNGGSALKLAHNRVPEHAPAPATSALAALHPELARAAAKTFPAARPQLAAATANFIARTSAHLAVNTAKPIVILRGHTRT
ncbi:MAG TPA: hypothetical protein VF007_12765 [Stellaceae bacterium]